jgi:uncharacterized protein (TIGR03437 family)
MAVDSSGAVYLIAGDVVKLTPSGDKIVYRTTLPKTPSAIAVDPAGNAYLAGQSEVYKLNPDGTLAYTTVIGDGVLVSAIAADTAGHAYVTGWTGTLPLPTTSRAFQTVASDTGSHSYVGKLSPTGAIEYATYVAGNVSEGANYIAVDGTGAAIISGYTNSRDFPVTPGAYKTTFDAQFSIPFVARVSADGSRLLYATFTNDATGAAQPIGGGPAGDTLVVEHLQAGVSILRLDGHGAVVWRSQPLPPVRVSTNGATLSLDAAGNAYFSGLATSANYPVKDSQAPCGSTFLTAFDAAGNVMQSTYLAAAVGNSAPAPVIALGAGGSVYIGGTTDVTKLSASSPARTVGLACVGNAASFDAGAVAPGEIVSLFGQGLGPAQGVQPDVTPKTGFPTKLADVQVAFDGTPAPLLYVHDGQINAIAPWRIAAGQTTNICVMNGAAPPTCVRRSVAAAVPGIFTVDGIHAAAVNEDGTVNSASNPAKVGTIISIFATGLGMLSPIPQDGAILDAPLPANTLPIRPYTVMGSAIAFQLVGIPMQYAGPAPQEVAGVSQINLRAGPSPMLLGVGPQLLVTDEVRSKSVSVWLAAR